MDKFTSNTERNKAASKLCQELFPQWSKPPFQGEIQNLIIEGWRVMATEDHIKSIVPWWMWARELMIENTFSNEEKKALRSIVVNSVVFSKPINIVSTRSPELLHAQVPGQGDKSLTRSRTALEKLNELVSESSLLLPTKATVIFADLAVDNIDKISKNCNVDLTIEENINRLRQIAADLNFDNLDILRMSQLIIDTEELSTLIDISGKPKKEIVLDRQAWKLIDIVTKESFESHARTFGWTEDESRQHNTHLATTMGLVGKAVKQMDPPALLIHNEAFIARGKLNNIFNSNQPLPVICLKDLLETKRTKV